MCQDERNTHIFITIHQVLFSLIFNEKIGILFIIYSSLSPQFLDSLTDFNKLQSNVVEKNRDPKDIMLLQI